MQHVRLDDASAICTLVLVAGRFSFGSHASRLASLACPWPCFMAASVDDPPAAPAAPTEATSTHVLAIRPLGRHWSRLTIGRLGLRNPPPNRNPVFFPAGRMPPPGADLHDILFGDPGSSDLAKPEGDKMDALCSPSHDLAMDLDRLHASPYISDPAQDLAAIAQEHVVQVKHANYRQHPTQQPFCCRLARKGGYASRQRQEPDGTC